MSEAKCAEGGRDRSVESLHAAVVCLEEALDILDDQGVSPEIGAQLDLVIHRLRDEIGRLAL